METKSKVKEDKMSEDVSVDQIIEQYIEIKEDDEDVFVNMCNMNGITLFSVVEYEYELRPASIEVDFKAIQLSFPEPKNYVIDM